jgi:hypothetical protein
MEQHERRQAPRYALIAEAEIVELGSKSRVQAKTSDFSLVGCFMNSAKSLPIGSKVEVKVRRGAESFTAQGLVARVHPMGMGVSFSKIQRDQESLLNKWLGEASHAA